MIVTKVLNHGGNDAAWRFHGVLPFRVEASS
jgi:hypothetical protein